GVGIIGVAGGYGSRDSLLGFQANPHCRVAAVCDINEGAVKQIARGNRLPQRADGTYDFLSHAVMVTVGVRF
ncbi:MAG TPA: hypothetical protein VJA21_26915, partial [Verrucomicrobiae bacterium]